MSTLSTEDLKPRPKRRALQVGGLALVILSFQTLGIIYSDIGTSPLYVLNGIWPTDGPVPPKDDVIGCISAIVWSLTFLPLLKYVFICLHFGTHEGEGGTFALYQGIYPPKVFEKSPTHESLMAGRRSRQNPKPPKSLRWPILIWALFGTSLTMADGVLTAAVSVTSAVGGIAVAKPSVSKDVVSISIAFLVVLFLAQPLGTSRLSVAFAPITFVWLLLLASTGIYNITKFPGIFRAFDPSRAVMYFVRTKQYDTLSGVLLAVTGCEALFANLGQFNMLSIQISFGSFVYPSLVLAYLGQGACLVVNGADVLPNVFYLTIPGRHNGPLFWILYVFAILATLIASQAMITATFSLVQQLVNQKCLPSLRLVHTSDKVQGQIYIPIANWILMIATIVIVAAFKSSTQLTNAYGFAVATVMFTTSVLISLQIRYIKHLPWIVGILFLSFFGFLDGLFWGASLKKVPAGAWVPLTLGVILLTIMAFWTWAKGLEDQFDRKSRRRLDGFIVPEGAGSMFKELEKRDEVEVVQQSALDENTTFYYVTPLSGVAGELEEHRVLTRLPIFVIFHGMSHERGVPPSFVSFIRQWPALPRFGIFLTVSVLPVAHVDAVDRYVVSRVDSLPGFYGVAQYRGFRDEPSLDIDEIVTKINDVEIRLGRDGAALVVSQLKDHSLRPTHVVPHYEVRSRGLNMGRITPVMNYIRRALIEEVYGRLSVMFPDAEGWGARADEIVHIGVTAKI
ncbi:potassium transporter [Russula ochroleuca]|uniref:Potassium transporter n=1 Tax=Russula ochroleuca TaxID=152965 RepID=A0A9P5MRX8_9AGAM|nr:potassium transporter [Russula ochroleuca]